MVTDWNASRYHEISAPQQAWGLAVLGRLPLEGDELVMDLGCGTGHLTAELARRLPRGRVVGLDRSAAMLAKAAGSLHQSSSDTRLVRADASALPFADAFDAVFSAATLHWVLDHATLFRSIHRALRPGGRLLAQCGGDANLAGLRDRARALMTDDRFRRHFHGWTEPWLFANTADTAARLGAAGFVDLDVTLEEAPTPFTGRAAFLEFVSTVCLRPHLERLPASEHTSFLAPLADQAAADDPPFTLDYWRLNISARRPAAS